ncbi:MAG: DUF3300 domain-containing protein, partial [Alphaproteobacteria bacterium]|nr:DUF3300 domain-containing protein [Alphaproteobacteria bacterium]
QPETTATNQTKPFTAEQLDHLLAPIALYPDPLLAQMLMAATYPMEVVEAARWSKANPDLKGEAALAAVKDKGWDVSVTSLVAFPQVLALMNAKLDWTQRVGDAMIAEQSDVAASIQRLRTQAQVHGMLQSNAQQTVSSQPPSAGAPADTPPAIVIQPTNPDMVYVPSYNPNVVYGDWPYPAPYLPYNFPPPSYGWQWGTAWGQAIGFGLGFAVAGAFFGGWAWGGGWGGGWGWGGWGGWGGWHSYTTVNVDRATHITNNFNRNDYDHGRWQHDPHHRDGVPYRDHASREKYGQHHEGEKERQAFRGKLDHEPETSGLRNAGRPEWNHGDDRPGNEGKGNERPGNEGRGSEGRGNERPGNEGRGIEGRGNEGRGNEDRRVADRGNEAHWNQRRNSFHGVNRGRQVHHEAERGHAYVHHAAHPAWHGGGHHGGGGHGGGHGGRR